MGQDFGQFNLGPDRTSKSKFNIKPLLTVFGILAAIAIIGVIAYVFINYYLLPQSRQAGATEADQLNAAATATAVMMTQEANISIWSTATERARITNTPAKTQTPVASKTPTLGTVDPRTATVAVLMTQAAEARMTATYLGTAGILPNTGFADEVGLPGLVSLSLVLVVVIFLVRRLRTSSQT
jgi:carbohydrate-binding DOMON domain-containing protein